MTVGRFFSLPPSLPHIFKDLGFIPVAFETAWVLAALAQPNHRVHLCSGPSLVCRLLVSSSVLDIVIFQFNIVCCRFF